MPLLKNGTEPKEQTVLNVLEDIGERVGEVRDEGGHGRLYTRVRTHAAEVEERVRHGERADAGKLLEMDDTSRRPRCSSADRAAEVRVPDVDGAAVRHRQRGVALEIHAEHVRTRAGRH